jgi:glycosyltransferase involved in cell wall biosynthesis
MTFSVIVPFLNEEKYIAQCINSLLDQDFNRTEYELIFVDNGSTDGSNAIASKFKEILLLHEERRNVYVARNKALEVAKGEIIAFTDADCVVCPDWLTQIYQGMRKSSADIVMGEIFFGKDISFALRAIENYLNARTEYILSRNYAKYHYGYTNNMAMKALIFKELGGFKEWPVPGDTEIIHRCLTRYPGVNIAYLKDMKVIHLEVTRLTIWWKKTFIYAKHNVLIEKFANFSPLSARLRYQIYRYCFLKNNYSLIKQFISFAVFGVNFIFYESGRIAGKIVKLMKE